MTTAFLFTSFLISVRLLPALVVAPIMFFARVPLTVRMVITLSVAAVMASALSADAAPTALSIELVASELLLGIALAFGLHAASAGVDFVGRLIDTQIGFNAAGVFDPSTSNVTGLIAELLSLTLALLFIVMDFHHALLRAFRDLLTVLPPGSMSMAVVSSNMAAVMAHQFLLAFMIVVPVIIGLWLTDAAFALMSRSMPQANVYFLALPVKLAVGIGMLLLSLPIIVQRMPRLFEHALGFPALPGGGL